MPPKRSEIWEASSIPEFKKRMTRSSTRAVETATQKSTAPSPKEAQEELQRTTRAKKPSLEDAKPEANLSNTQSTPKSSKALPSMTTTKFIHALFEKPIDCHEYTSNTLETVWLPASPLTLIFTHGAGGTLSSPTVANLCNGFSTTHSISVFQGSMSLKARIKGFHGCIEKLDARARGKQAKDKNTEITVERTQYGSPCSRHRRHRTPGAATKRKA
ncbi:hypothetical protein TW65_98100 [Stemphylium lycopersici]|nr:hypothetical protein TW65_98100 [Stemphylium lycopersici]